MERARASYIATIATEMSALHSLGDVFLDDDGSTCSID